MKVEAPSSIREIDKAPALAGRSVDRHAEDRVSMDEAARATTLVRAAAANAGANRSARLAQLEASVRTGRYRPTADHIAEQLLSTAEVDARLQTLLNRQP
jgi:hypothetical protein